MTDSPSIERESSIVPEDAISATQTTESEQQSEELIETEKPSHESIPAATSSYQIKPSLEEKFKETPVKEIIRNVLTGTLAGQAYDVEKVKKWTISIANDVNEKVRELHMKRYRHVVQVILGEMKGAGVKSGVRCLWDSDTDGYTSDVFINDTIFCVTTVFAIYLY